MSLSVFFIQISQFLKELYLVIITYARRMLTPETSELTGPDIWPPNRMAFRTSEVTVVLFHFLHDSNMKLIFLHLLCNNITVNMTKILIQLFKVMQLHKRCKVGELYILLLQIYCSIRLPKIIKIG